MIHINVMSADILKRVQKRKWNQTWLVKNRGRDRAAKVRAYWNDPDKYRRQKRESTFGKGSTEHIMTQIQKQKNLCAICRKEFEITPHLDHRHETGQWRGALCRNCNLGIGFFKENKESLRRAITYLKEWDLAYENSNNHPFETQPCEVVGGMQSVSVGSNSSTSDARH